VLAVGPGDINPETGVLIPMEVEVGSWVLFNQFSGHNIEYDGNDCIVLSANEITGIIDADDGLATTSSIEPLLNNVLVEIPPAEHQLESGLIISHGDSKKSPEYGTIVKVGKGGYTSKAKRIPIDLKVGDQVKFAEYSAPESNQFRLKEKVYAIVPSSSIIAKW